MSQEYSHHDVKAITFRDYYLRIKIEEQVLGLSCAQ